MTLYSPLGKSEIAPYNFKIDLNQNVITCNFKVIFVNDYIFVWGHGKQSISGLFAKNLASILTWFHEDLWKSSPHVSFLKSLQNHHCFFIHGFGFVMLFDNKVASFWQRNARSSNDHCRATFCCCHGVVLNLVLKCQKTLFTN